MNNNGTNLGKSSNGFLWGLIIGGGLVFLLGTKKGRRLLKAVTEDGFEGISELYDLFKEETEKYDEPHSEKKSKPTLEEDGLKHPSNGPTLSSIKRFFKGVPKKS